MSDRARKILDAIWIAIIVFYCACIHHALSTIDARNEKAGAGPALLKAIEAGWKPGPPPKRPERP